MGPDVSNDSDSVNREPAVSDSLRDNTLTSSETSSQLSSKSKSYPTAATGIYDVSRMNIPAGSGGGIGASAAHGGDRKSGLVRGLMTAISVPLIAGAGYLAFSGNDVHLELLTGTKPLQLQTAPPDPIGEAIRKPAAHVALPKPPPVEDTTPATEVTIATVAHDTATSVTVTDPITGSITKTTPASFSGPTPLKIVLDHKGEMISPLSSELDENGNEVVRIEPEAKLGPLALGEFTGATTLSSRPTPSGFSAIGPARPFTFTEAERRRIIQLRNTAPEIKSALGNDERIALGRTMYTPFATAVLGGSDNALTELHWMRAASVTRDISGDRSFQKRLLETIKAWATTYHPSGSALTDLPLLDALYAYDQVRHLWSTSEQADLDKFFTSLIDAQFSKISSQKVYGIEHAAHVRFATAVAYVTGSGTLQAYAQNRFKDHIENSKLSTLDSLGNDDVIALGHLLEAAVIFDRAGVTVYQNPKLGSAIDAMLALSQTPAAKLLETMAVAAYFRQDLYRSLPAAAAAAGVAGSRFGTSEGAMLAAIRKPTSVLAATAPTRVPSALPAKLPQKRR